MQKGMGRMLDYEKIGSFLSTERKKEKLTQKQLAEKINITFQAVSRWEKGISVPSLDVLDDLSRIFNVSIDEILKGERFNTRFSYEKAGVDVMKIDILNKKAKDYKDVNETLKANEAKLTDVVRGVIQSHTVNDISEEVVKKEALEKIQSLLDSKAVVEISLTNLMYN